MQQPPYPPKPSYPPYRPPFIRQPPLPLYRRAWRWYRGTPGFIQVGLGFLIFALLLCTFASFAAISIATNSLFTPTVGDTPTPAQQIGAQDTGAATAVPTPTDTPIPTATPTPTPEPTATSTPQPSPTPTPTLQPTQVVANPTPTACPGIACNPWGYNFVPGNLIYSPTTTFCSFFACINNFWNGHGYVVQCHDAQYSKLGGMQGACSSHNGVWRILYSH